MDKTMHIPTSGINYSQTKAVKCEKCECEVFQPAFLLRKVSALMSPSGKEAIVPVQLFACVACNHVNEDMYPIE
jgi:hypothetical protein